MHVTFLAYETEMLHNTHKKKRDSPLSPTFPAPFLTAQAVFEPFTI